MGTQFHFDPSSYLQMVRAEVPGYDVLQSALAEATKTIEARAILDLGTGTGVTAARVLALHPSARLVGIDCSEEMLAHARQLLRAATLRVARLEDPLPAGPFDLVVSAFAIHHLKGTAKADLFGRVASVLRLGGRFVFCDVVTPEGPVARPVPLDAEFDTPSSMHEQIAWMNKVGLEPVVIYAEDDLCILAGDGHVNRQDAAVDRWRLPRP